MSIAQVHKYLDLTILYCFENDVFLKKGYKSGKKSPTEKKKKRLAKFPCTFHILVEN